MVSSLERIGRTAVAVEEGHPSIEAHLSVVIVWLTNGLAILGPSAVDKAEDFALFVGSQGLGFLKVADLVVMLTGGSFLITEDQDSFEILGLCGTSLSCFTLGTFELLKEIDLDSGPA